MKKLLFCLGILAVIASFGYLKIASESGDYSTMGYDMENGYSLWRVNSSKHFIPGVDNTLDIGSASYQVRKLYIGTSITNSGSYTGEGITNTGSYTGSDSVSITTTSVGVSISTASTGVPLKLYGSKASLPTSGYSEGSILYITGTHKVYVATATVNDSGDWVALN